MKQLGLHEIRKMFLDFFEEKEHLIAPSYSLVPEDDDSLLLIGAGMAPIKKYFTGEVKAPSKRMATCQKCIRTGDIENVGKTDRHATFFEMLGNFSFGDYFKIEAIEWAWEFLHERLEIPEEQLWVSIYQDDDETFEIWNQHMKVDKNKIVRLGKEDNFWELEVGPSGPCSEIYVDRGEEYGCGLDRCQPGCDCDRFVEIWNLVFTQFDKDEKGVYHPLDHPNIDTGMGLERIAAIMEGVDNIFEVRAIKGIVDRVAKISNYNYGKDNKKDESVRVIADHIRAATFLVSDGILPGNEGRGYILRRLIRRAARHGKLLGIKGEFLTEIVEEVINSWRVEYKDLVEKQEEIREIIRVEESRFQETIDQGISIVESYIEDMEEAREKTLSGENAFKLYDTYGFPLDLTKEILAERDLLVDEESFNKKMEEQRKRARKAREKGSTSGWGSKISKDVFKGLSSVFKGYNQDQVTTDIIGLFKDRKEVEQLEEGQEGIIVLRETPFYGEAGGQVGDTGSIENENFKARVTDTQNIDEDIVIHMVEILSGKVGVKEDVRARISGDRRDDLRRNHTATHLLHQALNDVLGNHVNQSGSLVLPDRLRFDFSHYKSLSSKEISEIENIVNEKVLEGLSINTSEMTLDEAEKIGATGLFQDKYGDLVRVVEIGNYSKELCGGTHVSNTSNIGLFKIVSESGVASGVRRIEAITGQEVYRYINKMEDKINKVSNLLKTSPKDLFKKANLLIDEIDEKDNTIRRLRKNLSKDIVSEIVDSIQKVDGISYISYQVEDMDMENLRNLGDQLRDRIKSGVIVLASTFKNRLTFLAMVTKDLNSQGLLAGNIVKEVAKVTGGNGGGRPDMAQAGGKDLSKLDKALSIVPDLIEREIN